MATTPTAQERTRTLPGDELIPGSALVMDRATTLPAPPDAVWPWIVQLGKGRGGWYMPARIERRIVPRGRRSATRIDPRFQQLQPGDRVPDYGPGDPEFEVVRSEPPSTLLYRSQRGKTLFTWVLQLEPHAAQETRLHVRLRIRSGLPRRTVPLRALGDAFDWATIALLFGGLEERVRTPGASSGSRQARPSSR